VPYVFKGIKYNRWYRDDDTEAPDWLAVGELLGDPLGDLATHEGRLSVFLIESDKSNVDRVAAAMALTRDKLAHYDYILVDIDALVDAGFVLDYKPGTTPDSEVNEWHIDISQLSDRKVLHLLHIVWDIREYERLYLKDLEKLVVAGAAKGQYTKKRIASEKIKSRIEELLKVEGRNWHNS
jgi:hypothetical protein